MNHVGGRGPGELDVVFGKLQEDAPKPWGHLADVFRVKGLNKGEVVVVNLHLFVVHDVVVEFSDGKQGARGLQLDG